MERLSTFNQGKENVLSLENLRQLPSAVVLTGIECSGKTLFCERQLSAVGFSRISLDDEFEEAVKRARSSSERMLEALTISKRGGEITVYYPRNKEEFEQFFSKKILVNGIVKMSRMVIKGKKASLDGINITSYTRTLIVNVLRETGVKNVACVWIDTPIDECLRRFKKRGSGHSSRKLTEDILRKHASQFEPPTESEGFNLILRIPFKA